MDTSYFILHECPSLNQPLRFNGNHYMYWKQKMKDFIEATNINLWHIVELPKILVDEIVQPKVKYL